MKRKREGECMDIVWQTPANPPEPRDYIFRNGRRHVRPYYFEFIAHVKNRWAGKTIVDLFAEEFKGRPYEYYVNAVECGRIQVDGEMVPVSYIVKSSQKISHFLHRHEPPVMAWGVSVIEKEPDVVTVCKPASVPVHPCGQYRKNTVVGILQAEHGLAPLFPVHRLDRLVSGLLILARSAPKADFFRQQIEAGLVQKQYIAKVVGEFPEDEQVVDANINYNAREGRSTAEIKGSAKGKAACTKFTRISSNGTYSIVLCEPITGRTHQIRVHLQYLGHPLANDMLYLSAETVDRSSKGSSADRSVLVSDASLRPSFDEVRHKSEGDCSADFSIDPMCTNCPNLAPKGDAREGRSTAEIKGSAKGKAACTKFTRISSNGTYSIVLCEPITGRTHQIRVHLQYLGHPLANDMLYLSAETVDRSSKGSSADRSVLVSDASLRPSFDEVRHKSEGDCSADFSIDPMCTNCPNLAPKGYDGLEEGLWLHCFRYSGPGWTYECPYPDWAKLG